MSLSSVRGVCEPWFNVLNLAKFLNSVRMTVGPQRQCPEGPDEIVSVLSWLVGSLRESILSESSLSLVL